MLKFLKVMLNILIICPINTIFINCKTKKDYTMVIVKNNIDKLRVKLYRVTINKINHTNNIIYFSNHRSYADFLIDLITTEYCTKYVSRWIVAFYAPIFSFISGYFLYDMTIFFKRGGTCIPDFEKLIKKNQIANSGNNILVYPEGTRRTDLNYACDLKKGLIYYSYKENCPIQFIISKNKEKMINEKKYTCQKNVDIFVYYSDVYYPDIQKYKSMSEYYEYINNEWKTTFNLVYNTDYESKKNEYEQLDITKIHDNNYNIDTTKLWIIRIGIISLFTVIPSIFLKYIFSL